VLPEVIHGSDFMALLLEWAEKNGKSVFFLGAGAGVAEETARYFERVFPRLKVAGFSSANPSEAAFKTVRASKAEVLLVAYGAPKQEEWIAKYAARLKLFHVMGVGGSFDFWSGKIKRAPRLLRRLGLEWLWRLILQPAKRLRRIYSATIKFPLLSLFFGD
jgi:N-acetylglucosaminyldiphosphoundecaprenol N-acetyl-beta-D-mannosaminyltransferase